MVPNGRGRAMLGNNKASTNGRGRAMLGNNGGGRCWGTTSAQEVKQELWHQGQSHLTAQLARRGRVVFTKGPTFHSITHPAEAPAALHHEVRGPGCPAAG
jgi:hypothetical protein